ncbi:DUF3404 domain-containing protein [Vibrio coralliilyticus]|uniref:ATP-binding protein n=1 Tax=Vibrio coralliilyticus TaxID=190893 RepID=UPI000BAC1900|nr:DUF3404 domain-containing protein [Vibrio coralliilyticus]NOI74697.1 DUF3404 domain-containing protein [Vibrio coralliilyticus]PAW05285.1 histidine kinase [Vibrio coralliilyticus]
MPLGKLAACFLFLFPLVAQAQSLQENWQSLYQQSWQATELKVTQQQLSQYPAELLKQQARYPDFKQYNWQEIEQVYRVSQTCQKNEQHNANLNDAIEFELAMCNDQLLTDDWFQAHTLLHPAGGSFADRYLDRQPNYQPSHTIHRYLTIDNPQHPLHAALSTLSNEGREALLNGYRAWMEKDTLWLSGEQGWKAVTAETWQPVAKRLDITLSGPNCTFRYSNLCISDVAENVLALRLFVAGLSILILFMTVKTLYTRRQQSREKRFILQLLTHELRTPITSLGLTVEMFRSQFDRIPNDTQDAVWRLMSDHQRLSQLTENSKIYLSTQRSQQLLKQTASLDDWLEHTCEKHALSYQLNQDRELTLPFYWLSICLDNLIKNAKQHGHGKIEIRATLTHKLVIEVTDQGDFPSAMAQFFTKFQGKTNHENMGIGLSIVEHLMKLMGGKLIVRRRPTRCILELPL